MNIMVVHIFVGCGEQTLEIRLFCGWWCGVQVWWWEIGPMGNLGALGEVFMCELQWSTKSLDCEKYVQSVKRIHIESYNRMSKREWFIFHLLEECWKQALATTMKIAPWSTMSEKSHQPEGWYAGDGFKDECSQWWSERQPSVPIAHFSF